MLLQLELAYEGTNFRGWARQPGLRTVEQTVSDGLARIYRSVGPLAVAGRTDAGVHALANVASVEVEAGPPPQHAARALNAVLPADVAALDALEAPPGFHARFSAHSRSYRYRILQAPLRSPFEARRSLWHPAPLDLAALVECAEALPGEHDFRAFTPSDTQHQVFARRVLAARWVERGPVLEFEIVADSFLRHMVRTLVGTMLERSPAEFAELLRGAERSAAGSTAPACGLTLVSVDYDAVGLSFRQAVAAPG
jgi:tRNA pseudouridine38-40 synthase